MISINIVLILLQNQYWVFNNLTGIGFQINSITFSITLSPNINSILIKTLALSYFPLK